MKRTVAKIPLVFTAFNVQGALSKDNWRHVSYDNIESLTNSLADSGTVVAALSEPRFGPGLEWPGTQWLRVHRRALREAGYRSGLN